MSRHPNQHNGTPAMRRAHNLALGIPVGERIARGKYELRNESGAVLAVCDKLEPLLKNIDQKPGATILRGGVVVWPVEGSAPTTRQGAMRAGLREIGCYSEGEIAEAMVFAREDER